jgi:outer membrane lipoprotein-sorting protein
LVTASIFAGDPDGYEILQAIDRGRNFNGSDFSAVMTMIQEDPENGIDKKIVQQFRRDREDKFVMLFVEPEVKKGQGYLRIEDNLWFYDPESRKFAHSSMKEHFGGTDAKNSDFGMSNLEEDYSIVSIEEGTLGSYDIYLLDLEANNDEVTYPKQKIWVTRENYLVLKSEDYSASGRLLRTSFFPSYAKSGEQFIPTRMIFVDELVEGKKTEISLNDISLSDLPDSLFSKAYIERVNR